MGITNDLIRGGLVVSVAEDITNTPVADRGRGWIIPDCLFDRELWFGPTRIFVYVRKLGCLVDFLLPSGIQR